MNSRIIKLGDVFEIETSKGKSYLHYIYKDKTLGNLIRVLPSVFKEKPDNMDEIISQKEDYMIFFALPISIKMKIVRFVGFYPIDNFTKPEFMRIEHNIRGDHLGWDIVNTETWNIQFVEELNGKQKKLSPWGIWSGNLLKENIERGWNLENWC